MAKVKELKKEVKVPYIVANNLVEKIALLRVPTYGDFEKFKNINDKLVTINQELTGKIQELFKKHDITEVKEGDEKFDIVNKEYRELVISDSSVSREDIQSFTKTEFARIYEGSNLTLQDAIALEYWLIKE